MKASQTLRRLLRIRALEAEQSRRALESAEAALRPLEMALAATQSSAHLGREWVVRSAQNGDAYDRIAGVEQTRASESAAAWIAAEKAAAEDEAAARKVEFLADYRRRKQTESLLNAAETQGDKEAEKRSQEALDDWHLMRRTPAKKQKASRS